MTSPLKPSRFLLALCLSFALPCLAGPKKPNSRSAAPDFTQPLSQIKVYSDKIASGQPLTNEDHKGLSAALSELDNRAAAAFAGDTARPAQKEEYAKLKGLIINAQAMAPTIDIPELMGATRSAVLGFMAVIDHQTKFLADKSKAEEQEPPAHEQTGAQPEPPKEEESPAQRFAESPEGQKDIQVAADYAPTLKSDPAAAALLQEKRDAAQARGAIKKIKGFDDSNKELEGLAANGAPAGKTQAGGGLLVASLISNPAAVDRAAKSLELRVADGVVTEKDGGEASAQRKAQLIRVLESLPPAALNDKDFNWDHYSELVELIRADSGRHPRELLHVGLDGVNIKWVKSCLSAIDACNEIVREYYKAGQNLSQKQIDKILAALKTPSRANPLDDLQASLQQVSDKLDKGAPVGVLDAEGLARLFDRVGRFDSRELAPDQRQRFAALYGQMLDARDRLMRVPTGLGKADPERDKVQDILAAVKVPPPPDLGLEETQPKAGEDAAGRYLDRFWAAVKSPWLFESADWSRSERRGSDTAALLASLGKDGEPLSARYRELSKEKDPVKRLPILKQWQIDANAALSELDHPVLRQERALSGEMGDLREESDRLKMKLLLQYYLEAHPEAAVLRDASPGLLAFRMDEYVKAHQKELEGRIAEDSGLKTLQASFDSARAKTDDFYKEHPDLSRYDSGLIRYRRFLSDAVAGGRVPDGALIDPRILGLDSQRLKLGTAPVKITLEGRPGYRIEQFDGLSVDVISQEDGTTRQDFYDAKGHLVKGMKVSAGGEVLERRRGRFNDKGVLVEGFIATPEGRTEVAPAALANRPDLIGISYAFTAEGSDAPARRVTILADKKDPDRPAGYIVETLGADGKTASGKVEYSFEGDEKGNLRLVSSEWVRDGKSLSNVRKYHESYFSSDPRVSGSSLLKSRDLLDLNVRNGEIVLAFPDGREHIVTAKGDAYDRIGEQTVRNGSVSEPVPGGIRVTGADGKATLYEPRRGGALEKVVKEGQPPFYAVDKKLWEEISEAAGPERSNLVDMLAWETGEELGWDQAQRAQAAVFLKRGLEDAGSKSASLSISGSSGLGLSFGRTSLVAQFGDGVAAMGRVLMVMTNDPGLTPDDKALLDRYNPQALRMPDNMLRYEIAPGGVIEYTYKLKVDYLWERQKEGVRRIGLQVFAALPGDAPRLAAEYDLQKMMTDWQRFSKAVGDATPIGATMKVGQPLMDLGKLVINAMDAGDKDSEAKMLEQTAQVYGLSDDEKIALAKIMKESDRAQMLEILAFYSLRDSKGDLANKQGALKEILGEIKDPQARRAVEERVLRNGIEEMKSGIGWNAGNDDSRFQNRLARRMLSTSDDNLMVMGFDRFNIDERHKEMLDDAAKAQGWRSAGLYAEGILHKATVMTAEALPGMIVTAPLGGWGAALQGPSKVMLAWSVADGIGNALSTTGQGRIYAFADVAGNLGSLAALHFGTKAFHEVFYAEETQKARAYEKMQKEAQEYLEKRGNAGMKERLAALSHTEFSPPPDPADIGGLKVPKMGPVVSDPLSYKLSLMEKNYAKPDNARVKPAFMKVGGEYADVHTGIRFSDVEMAQLKAWGNEPEMMTEPAGYRFDGVDPVNKNKILVTNLEKGLQYSIEVTGSRISGTINAVGHSQAPGGGAMAERLSGVEFKGELNFLHKNQAYRTAYGEANARAGELLREAARNPDGSRNPVHGQGEAIRLKAVLEVLTHEMPYSHGMIDPAHGNGGQLPGKTNVAELISRGGVCRHQNMVGAAMVEDMIASGKLDGEVRYVTGNGHAWSVFKSAETGRFYVLDVAQGNVGEMTGKKYSGVEPVWKPDASHPQGGAWEWKTRAFDYLNDSATAAERKAPAASPAGATPESAANKEAMKRAVWEQFEATQKDFAKGGGPDDFVGKLQKTEALPENGRSEAVAKKVQQYLGLSDTLTASKPKTDPLSGAQVFLVKNPQGEVVGVYKVFTNDGKGPKTIMNELGAGRELGSLGLEQSKPVDALGAWRLGDSGEIGYLMEAAKGKDFYEYFKDVGQIKDPAARERRLTEVQGYVEKLARAMEEVHRKSRSTDPVEEGKKRETVSKTLDLVEKLGRGAGNENLPGEKVPEDVARAMKERLGRVGADYVKENLPASVTHGDAHPGNFFFDEKTGKITMIDLETAMESVSAEGRGTNSPMADVGRFKEVLALSNEAKGIGLKPREISALQAAFDKAYADASGFSSDASDAHARFYQAKMQTTALKFARSKAEFDQAVDAIRRDLGLAPKEGLGAQPPPKPVAPPNAGKISSFLKGLFGAKTEESAGPAKQQELAKDFSARVAFDPPEMTRLPKGVPERYVKGLETIRNLLGSKDRFFARMQELETEVSERSARTGETPEKALQGILTQWEKNNGFKPAIELENKGYSDKQWYEMLSEGAMFRDTLFKDIKREGREHGYETHRLQWNLVMREMIADPKAFGGVTQASELFKFLGDTKVMEKLDWSSTGVKSVNDQDIWFQLFDGRGNNFSCPEYTRRNHDYYPGLGQWY